MDGWFIGLLAGAVVLVLLVVLLGVVVKAAERTAATAQAVLVALEEVKANTAPLAALGSFEPETGPTAGPETGRVRGPLDGGGNGAGT